MHVGPVVLTIDCVQAVEVQNGRVTTLRKAKGNGGRATTVNTSTSADHRSRRVVKVSGGVPSGTGCQRVETAGGYGSTAMDSRVGSIGRTPTLFKRNPVRVAKRALAAGEKPLRVGATVEHPVLDG